MALPLRLASFFFFNDTATTEIYTLSLHDALPISLARLLSSIDFDQRIGHAAGEFERVGQEIDQHRSEEHTSELQSQSNLVCRLLLEKKKILLIVFPSPSTTSSHRSSAPPHP